LPAHIKVQYSTSIEKRNGKCKEGYDESYSSKQGKTITCLSDLG